ncbi:MAG: hypothetical protein KF901_19760 [Myxococcales bacterium]|nr:hypothetical protein [Myxococcales bacterium]
MLRVIFAALLAFGCAKGTVADEDAGGNTGVDGGPRDGGGTDGGNTDAGGRDGGGADSGPACVDEHPNDCPAAHDVGMLAVGAAPIEITAHLPTLDDVDWFVVRFPAANSPGTFGGGEPRIQLEGDETMVLDIRPGCATMTPVSCGEGSATMATSYSFTDNQAMEGEEQWSRREVEWPSTLYVRVARTRGPANCTPYTLTFAR